MDYIEWGPALDVGVEEFNAQHRQLFKLINDLFEAMHVGKGREIIGKVLAGLADYTVYHFEAEEKRFDEFGYPAAVAHKAEHADFVRRVDELKKQYDTGAGLVTVDTLGFIREWISNHIMKTDKAYAEFFHAQGVS